LARFSPSTSDRERFRDRSLVAVLGEAMSDQCDGFILKASAVSLELLPKFAEAEWV
jgi:hypothetical protein